MQLSPWSYGAEFCFDLPHSPHLSPPPCSLLLRTMTYGGCQIMQGRESFGEHGELGSPLHAPRNVAQSATSSPLLSHAVAVASPPPSVLWSRLATSTDYWDRTRQHRWSSHDIWHSFLIGTRAEHRLSQPASPYTSTTPIAHAQHSYLYHNPRQGCSVCSFLSRP